MPAHPERFFADRFGLNAGAMERLLGSTLTGRVEHADLFLEYRISEELVLEEGAVKKAARHVSQGAGVRAQSGERTGYAHTDDLALPNLEEAARQARAIADRSSASAVVAVSHDGAPHDLYRLAEPPIAANLDRKLALLGQMDGAAQAGLKFFADLNKAGNFVPVIGKAASLAQGATPIIIRWDYNALADRDTLKGNPKVAVVVPKNGVVAGVYVQAVSAFAPHPNAAKLWMEHLYSDEGQVAWLKGYCHPIRFQDLVKNKKVPADLLAKLPPAESYDKAVFPTLEQQAAAKEIITKQWDSVVGANVK